MRMKLSDFSMVQQEVYQNIQFRITDNSETLLDAVYVTIKNVNSGPLDFLIDESDLENVMKQVMVKSVK
jgi:hypothetical protein